MRLTILEPHWLKRVSDRSFKKVYSLQEADGIRFLCPLCWKVNDGPVGTHSILCWRPHVPQSCYPAPGRWGYPAPGRWEFQGSSFEDLTLVASSSSILLLGGCKAHFFIRNGEIC